MRETDHRHDNSSFNAASFLLSGRTGGGLGEEENVHQDPIDKEWEETLALTSAHGEYLSQVIFGAGKGGRGDLFGEETTSASGAGDRDATIKAAKDAIDYSGLDELAADEGTENHGKRGNHVKGQGRVRHSIPHSSIQPKPSSRITTPALRPSAKTPLITIHNLHDIFPSFLPEAPLKFSELFAIKLSKMGRNGGTSKRTSTTMYTAVKAPSNEDSRINSKKKQPETCYHVAPCDDSFWKDPTLSLRFIHHQHRSSSFQIPTDDHKDEDADSDMTKLTLPIELESWENHVLWDEEASIEAAQMLRFKIQKEFIFRNEILDKGTWIQDILWSPLHDDTFLPSRDMNMDWVAEGCGGVAADIRVEDSDEELVPLVSDLKFNLSNDAYYQARTKRDRQKQDRVRQAYGPAILLHSLPAIQLNHSYFRPQLSTDQLRAGHRHQIDFPTHVPLIFSRVHSVKTKKLQSKDASEVMKHSKDVTLKDTSKYVLLEYSEEHPPLMMNSGMASFMYNYYRKKDPSDEFAPEMDNGSAYILDSKELSPFHPLGEVEPGQTIQALYNNLFRAPIFRQSTKPTDFLIIRHTTKTSSSYFIRPLGNLYVVGQMLPYEEVPRPQSRKVNYTIRGRIQAVAYRAMRRDPRQWLNFEKIRASFPMYSEAHLRHRLKDFVCYAKKGNNTGWWKAKPKVPILDEEEIRKLVTPEQVCAIEAMLYGQQRLMDAGYALEYEGGDQQDDVEENAGGGSMEVEVMLAPWKTTKNFIQAAQGKGLLKLNGPGDPTGRGEGFSYIRHALKDAFYPTGYTADEVDKTQRLSVMEKLAIYQTEKDRIWKNQLISLASQDEPQLSDDEMEEEKYGDDEESLVMEKLRRKKDEQERAEESDRQKLFGSVKEASFDDDSRIDVRKLAGSRNVNEFSAESTVGDRMDDASSIGGTSVGGVGSKNKILVINRLMKASSIEGKGKERLEWQSEIISDSKVIIAYVRQRKLLEAKYAENANTIRDDPFLRRRILQEHLNRFKQIDLGKGKRKTFNDEISGIVAEDALGPARAYAGPVKVTIDLKAMQSKAFAQADGRAFSQPPPTITLNLNSIMKPGRKKARTDDSDGPSGPHYRGQRPPVPAFSSHDAGSLRRRNPVLELNKFFFNILKQIMARSDSAQFCVPVARNLVPDYYTHIKHPKNFDEMRTDAKNRKYQDVASFKADVDLIKSNCFAYNTPSHPFSVIISDLHSRIMTRLESKAEELAYYEERIREENNPSNENKYGSGAIVEMDEESTDLALNSQTPNSPMVSSVDGMDFSSTPQHGQVNELGVEPQNEEHIVDLTHETGSSEMFDSNFMSSFAVQPSIPLQPALDSTFHFDMSPDLLAASGTSDGQQWIPENMLSSSANAANDDTDIFDDLEEELMQINNSAPNYGVILESQAPANPDEGAGGSIDEYVFELDSAPLSDSKDVEQVINTGIAEPS